jgi:hypothetical protein
LAVAAAEVLMAAIGAAVTDGVEVAVAEVVTVAVSDGVAVVGSSVAIGLGLCALAVSRTPALEKVITNAATTDTKISLRELVRSKQFGCDAIKGDTSERDLQPKTYHAERLRSIARKAKTDYGRAESSMGNVIACGARAPHL